MTKDLLARCNRGQLQRLLQSALMVQGVYEELCDGPHGAAVHREYMIARQSERLINSLLYELAD